MKTLIFSLFLMLSTVCFSQYSLDNVYESPAVIDLNLDFQSTESTSQSKSRRYGYNETSFPLGPAMMLGGATFVVAGLLTVPDYSVGPDGETLTKPFFKQGARMLAIVSGAGLLTVGAVVSIGGGR